MQPTDATIASPTSAQIQVASAPASMGRVLCGYCAVVFVPALLLVDGATALARGCTIFSRFDYLLLYGAFGWTAAATIGLAFSSVRRFFARNAARLILVLIAVLFAIALLEIGIRLFDRVAGVDIANFHRRPAKYTQEFHPAEGVMPGVVGPTHYTMNSLGVRGEELPARDQAYRILCIGGSTTECLYLDDSQAWPHLVEAQLSARHSRPHWVGATGVSGYTTSDHLRFVRGAKLVNEMDCLVLLVGANDLARAIYKPPMPIWRDSRIIEMARHLLNWGTAIEVEDNAGKVYTVRRQTRAEAGKRDAFPDVASEVEKYKQRIRELTQACRDKQIRPVFVTQPGLISNGLEPAGEKLLWMGMLSSGEFLTPAAFARLRDLYNHALIDTCRELGADCIDVSSMNGRSELYYDDWHYNVAGSQEIARLISDYLSAHPPHNRSAPQD